MRQLLVSYCVLALIITTHLSLKHIVALAIGSNKRTIQMALVDTNN